MIADVAMSMGSSHHVCEDYARATVTEGEACLAVLSDGCSSSPDTDFGSRLLVMEAIQTLCIENHLAAKDVYPLYVDIIKRAFEHVRLIGLDERCLDATLMILMVNASQIIMTCWGDGVMVQRFASGTICARVISYPKGFPSYPSYLLNPDREEYRKKMNDVETTFFCIRADGGTYINRSFGQVAIGAPLFLPCSYACIPTNEEDRMVAVAIFSDGIGSFYRTVSSETTKTKQPIDIVELLPKLMAFKGKGKFARRRLNGLMKKDPEISHYDDVSMGAVLL